MSLPLGGGMYNVNSSPTVTNCIFYGNSVADPTGWYESYGGGMYNDNSSDPIITNSIFYGNHAEGGYNGSTINQFLLPFRQTAKLCKMTYLPPFVVHGTHMLDQKGIEEAGREYRRVITALRDGNLSEGAVADHEYSNDINL